MELSRTLSQHNFLLCNSNVKAYLHGTTLSHATSLRQAYDTPTTRIVLCKSNIPLAYDCRARPEKCRRILKHVLKRYDNRSRN